MYYFMNTSLGIIEDTKGFQVLGSPGVINCGFPPTAAGSQTVEDLAKEAINSANQKGMKYDAFAAYTFGKRGKSEIADEYNETKGLDLMVVVPLKKILKKK